MGGLEAVCLLCKLPLIGRANGDAFQLELLNYNLTTACTPKVCPNTHTHAHIHTFTAANPPESK